jgi:tRNA(Ile2) C34 agmatinyltransferase TiaS
MQRATTDKQNAISSTNLAALYNRNEISADAANKGHIVVVKGTVDRIAKDILDKPYITLRRIEGQITAVQCSFTKADEPRLALLSPGDKIYVKGSVKGKMINVLMDHCKVLD